MTKAIDKGFVGTGLDVSAVQIELDQFKALLNTPLNPQDTLSFSYAQELGTAVVINGKLAGRIKGLAFKQVLFSIWLGENPVQSSLKRDLLGQTP